MKNLRSKIFFFVKSESKILKNSIFKKFYKSNCTFYYEISIWNDFSFHLMYILSILVKNYRFSKIYILKAENFLPWNEVTLEPHCGNILNQRMIFKDSIEEWICQMSLETISGEFWWKMGAYDHIKPLGLIQPLPRSLDRRKSPVWLGLKNSNFLWPLFLGSL